VLLDQEGCLFSFHFFEVVYCAVKACGVSVYDVMSEVELVEVDL